MRLDHAGLGRKVKAVGEVDASGFELFDFVVKFGDVDDATGANVHLFFGIEDGGRDLFEGDFLAFVNDGVAGVGAAVETSDDVVVLGFVVNNSRFAFVAVLSADYDVGKALGCGHWYCVSSLS